MTTEIAIMNKIAVALAADSALTIRTENGLKIYNTDHKLFTLSNQHPVGIMVYGNGALMGVPWDPIIDIYRQKLGKKKFDTLREYAMKFIFFLETSRNLFPKLAQEECFYNTMGRYFTRMKSEMEEEVKSLSASNTEIPEKQIKEIAKRVIKRHFEKLEKTDTLPTIPAKHFTEIRSMYSAVIDRVVHEVFEELPLTLTARRLLSKIGVDLCCKDIWESAMSGIVFAGFGEEAIFPSLVSLNIEAVFNNRLKWAENNQSAEIGLDDPAQIIPFGQCGVISTFIEGIDHEYKEALERSLPELLEMYTDRVAELVPRLDEGEKKDLAFNLKKASAALLEDFEGKHGKFRHMKYVAPITEAVEFLPKAELVAMAEALVNLTSLRQRVSLELETVGGPIDVAVISKGDGFVWVKRKQHLNAMTYQESSR